MFLLKIPFSNVSYIFSKVQWVKKNAGVMFVVVPHNHTFTQVI
jgi:hypothetical protein